MTNETITEERKSNSTRIIVVLALVLLVGADLFLLYNLFDKNTQISTIEKEKKQVEVMRDSLQIQVNNLEQELAKFREENSSFLDSITGQRDFYEMEIAKLKALVRSGDPVKLKIAQGKLKDLTRDLESVKGERDKLLAENGDLRMRNSSLTSDLQNEKMNTDALISDKNQLKQKIKDGSVLNADNIQVTPTRVKKNGKEYKSDKAKSVSKVKGCIHLQQNLVTEPGIKTIYMRVLGPDKSVISSNAGETFKMGNGDQSLYTEKKDVNYQNTDMDLCIVWKNGNAFQKGNYTVEFYESGVLIGKSSFTLK